MAHRLHPRPQARRDFQGDGISKTPKMKLRTFVVFKTDFPDEPTWMKSGDLLRGPGFKTASILIEMLKQSGLKVSEPCERDYYGWEFDVSGGITFVIQHGGEETQEGEESLLLLSDTSFFQRLFDAKKLGLLHRDVLEKLNDFLNRDGRFHAIRWFTREDYESNKSSDSSAGHSEP